MNIAIILLILIPALVKGSGDGNIRLLEEEVAVAMKACVQPTDVLKDANRQRRSNENIPRTEINDNRNDRKNISNSKGGISINTTDTVYDGYAIAGNNAQDPSNMPPFLEKGYENGTNGSSNRTRRGEPLMNKPDTDQCLSQCIFANLQIVDSRGIPREAEFWGKVQATVTSQQSRAALRDQIRACFQELQSEAEDNGCSYSNKLERCLMLRFSDRKIEETGF